jgi:hypothetical protein
LLPVRNSARIPNVRIFRLIACLLIVCTVVLEGEIRQIQTGFLDRSVLIAGATHRFAIYVPVEYAAVEFSFDCCQEPVPRLPANHI